MPLAQKAQEAGFLVRRLGHEPPDTTQSILTRLRELYPSCGFSYTDAPETQGLHIVLPVADLKQGLPKAVLYAATRILRRRADGSLYVRKDKCFVPFTEVIAARYDDPPAVAPPVRPTAWEHVLNPAV